MPDNGNVMTDSERVIMVSYQCSIVSFSLSYTVSEIMRFSCKPKMTLSICVRQGALCKVFNDGIWKGDYGFLLVLNSNFDSIMHRFRDNDVFLRTVNGVMVLHPLGTLYAVYK